MRYHAEVSYKDRNGERYLDRYVADLGPVIGLQAIVRKDTHEAAKALERVAQTLESWTATGRGVNALVHDYDRSTRGSANIATYSGRPALRRSLSLPS